MYSYFAHRRKRYRAQEQLHNIETGDIDRRYSLEDAVRWWPFANLVGESITFEATSASSLQNTTSSNALLKTPTTMSTKPVTSDKKSIGL
jgi:hypothetical protein